MELVTNRKTVTSGSMGVRRGYIQSPFFHRLTWVHAHFTKICLAVFCKFLGDFGGCLGRDSFSQRISKIWRNKKYERYNVILNLEFEVKN